jgi:hypothetical protein
MCLRTPGPIEPRRLSAGQALVADLTEVVLPNPSTPTNDNAKKKAAV